MTKGRRRPSSRKLDHMATIEREAVPLGPPIVRARRVLITRPLPPSAGSPSDDDLLRYLDGAMRAGERAAFERRLEASPFARQRLEILAEALGETDPSDA